jgi:hypothetical protein
MSIKLKIFKITCVPTFLFIQIDRKNFFSLGPACKRRRGLAVERSASRPGFRSISISQPLFAHWIHSDLHCLQPTKSKWFSSAKPRKKMWRKMMFLLSIHCLLAVQLCRLDFFLQNCCCLSLFQESLRFNWNIFLYKIIIVLVENASVVCLGPSL